MKKVFCKLVFLTFVIGISVTYFSSTGCSSMQRIKGDGNVTTSEKTVPRFEKINSRGVAEVRYHASDEYRVVVTTDANLHKYVEVFTQDNVLNIGNKSWNYKFTKFVIDVYCPALAGVSMSGSGSFAAAEKIVASTFEARVSGSGRIEGTIECEKLSGTVSGSGRITFAGTSKEANIVISGSGNFNGNNFIAKSASITVSGSGRANICVEENLDARVSGSGSINYCGEPAKVNSNVSGSGRIRKM